MSPKTRRRIAMVLLVASLIAWPTTMILFPGQALQITTGLSWAAISLTLLDVLATTDVRAESTEESGDK